MSRYGCGLNVTSTIINLPHVKEVKIVPFSCDFHILVGKAIAANNPLSIGTNEAFADDQLSTTSSHYMPQ